MATVTHTDWGDGDWSTNCATCGSGDVDRIECDNCGGDGWRDSDDLMEEDPLWYEPGDTERCSECGGEGGWWHCYDCARDALAKREAG